MWWWWEHLHRCLVCHSGLKTIKCRSLAVFFGNPTSKIVSGTAYTWELLIANHLDQSLWSTNQNYWAALRSNAHFTSRGNLHEFGASKPISWAQPAHFDFFTINFTLWSHILWALVEMFWVHHALFRFCNKITSIGPTTHK